jgi:hypothetical protein
MTQNIDAPLNPHHGNSSSRNYLALASQASEEGDIKLALHLYLAAFQQAQEASDAPSEDAIMGLKQAWHMACTTKERALAEYIFEQLEPYLTHEELDVCAEELQRLALDKLEQYGFSRDDLEDMASTLSEEMGGLDHSPLMMAGPFPSFPHHAKEEGRHATDAPSDPRGEHDFQSIDILTYDSISGYETIINRMRALGIGAAGSPEYDEFIALMNARHGVEAAPVADCILFCSPAREDASRFMAATVGELGFPAIRMRMEESMQGFPMLSISAQAKNPEQLAAMRRGFEGGGVLVLEDIDLWGSPVIEVSGEETLEERLNMMMASMSRGAREALNLIRQSVDSPEVYVLASATAPSAIDPFFMDLLYPLTCVDIDYPNEEERADIWADIARTHPSIRGLDREELVQLTVNMPRYDIYMAARESIEGAYKRGLIERRYIPVTRENLFEKLASYQPLDSPEYERLEEAVIEDFANELENLENISALQAPSMTAEEGQSFEKGISEIHQMVDLEEAIRSMLEGVSFEDEIAEGEVAEGEVHEGEAKDKAHEGEAKDEAKDEAYEAMAKCEAHEGEARQGKHACDAQGVSALSEGDISKDAPQTPESGEAL